MLRRDDKVLLLRRANTGYQDGKYSIIAGHLDGDELAKDGMVCEAKEEAGITVSPKSLKLAHVAHRLTRNQPGEERIDLFFEATKWEGEVRNVEPEKCDDFSWHPITALPDNMLPLVRNVINDIVAGINYSEYEVEPVWLARSGLSMVRSVDKRWNYLYPDIIKLYKSLEEIGLLKDP